MIALSPTEQSCRGEQDEENSRTGVVLVLAGTIDGTQKAHAIIAMQEPPGGGWGGETMAPKSGMYTR